MKAKKTTHIAPKPPTAIRARRAPPAVKKRKPKAASTRTGAETQILIRLQRAEKQLLKDAAAHRINRATGELGFSVPVNVAGYVLQAGLAAARRELVADDVPSVLDE